MTRNQLVGTIQQFFDDNDVAYDAEQLAQDLADLLEEEYSLIDEEVFEDEDEED